MMETCSYLMGGGSGRGGGGVGCLDVLVPSPSLGLDLALLVQPELGSQTHRRWPWWVNTEHLT